MKDKIAIFSCKGIGDGMFAMQFAHQLTLSGKEVILYHPTLHELSSYFPHVEIQKDPNNNERSYEDFFSSFKEIIFIYENSERQRPLREFALKNFSQKTWVINPIASHRKDVPFWDHGRFNGRDPFAENIFAFCKNSLRLPYVSFSQGLVIEMKQKTKRSKKIKAAIHPFSSKEEKNWPITSYLALAKKLKKMGVEVLWIGTDQEKSKARLPLTPHFAHLSELMEFLPKVDIFIGNDSGIGHLCSALGIPTVTICRSHRIINFWQPSWSTSLLIAPPSWVPNCKPFRLRDQKWKSLITVSSVLRKVAPLIKKLHFDKLSVFDDKSSDSTVNETHLECSTE